LGKLAIVLTLHFKKILTLDGKVVINHNYITKGNDIANDFKSIIGLQEIMVFPQCFEQSKCPIMDLFVLKDVELKYDKRDVMLKYDRKDIMLMFDRRNVLLKYERRSMLIIDIVWSLFST
jgi:hypothetical protein